MPPVLTELVPYFAAPWLRRGGVVSRLAGGLGTLLKAAAVLALALAVAGLLLAVQLGNEAKQNHAPFDPWQTGPQPFVAPAPAPGNSKQKAPAPPGQTINPWR